MVSPTGRMVLVGVDSVNGLRVSRTAVRERGLAVRWVLVEDDFCFGARRVGDFAMLKAFSAKCGFEAEEMPAPHDVPETPTAQKS